MTEKTTMTIQEMPENLLKLAEKITSGARRRDYGRPYLNHLRIAIKWARRINRRVKLGLPPVTASVVVAMMKDLKEARQENTPKFDNLLDDVGYTVCLDDMARQCVELGLAQTYEDALVYLDRQDIRSLEDILEKLEG